MPKFKKLIKNGYISLILLIVYIPLVFAAIFAFNTPPKKGSVSFTNWNGFTSEGFSDLFSGDIFTAIINTLVLGFLVATIVSFISLITVYSMWRQKSKTMSTFLSTTSNIPLINPEIITALALTIMFGTFFGTLGELELGETGLFRVVISHTVVILPFGITIMYPKSSKFNASMMEASSDLGYGPIKSWLKTYFIFMLPIIIITFIAAFALSMDDFILARITSKYDTVGVILYEEASITNWKLLIGALMLAVVITSSISYILFKNKKLNLNKNNL